MLAHLRRGDAYRRRGELTAALRDLRQAAALDPSAPDPVELSGDVHVAMGRYALAAEDYKAFTLIDDRSPRVLYKLGMAYYRNQQIEEAIVPLRSAIALDARLAEAHYLLGVCLRERSENEEARQALTTALEISPTFAAVREELVSLYEAAGRRREAIEQLEALAALEPTHPERLVNVGIAYANWGRTDAAVLTLARAADRFPDEPSVRTALGRVWLAEAERDGDPVALEKALEALRPSASSPTASGETLTLLGRALLFRGRSASQNELSSRPPSALRRIPSHFVTWRMPQNGSGTPPSPRRRFSATWRSSARTTVDRQTAEQLTDSNCGVNTSKKVVVHASAFSSRFVFRFGSGFVVRGSAVRGSASGFVRGTRPKLNVKANCEPNLNHELVEAESVRVQERERFLVAGSSASRSPSPRKLNPSTRTAIARPGKIVRCGASSRCPRP